MARATAHFTLQARPCRPRDGFRKQQVKAYVQAVIDSGRLWPSYGQIARDLAFYDRAGAYRVVMRLLRDGEIKNNAIQLKDAA